MKRAKHASERNEPGRTKKAEGRLPAGNNRGREAQRPDVIEKEMNAAEKTAVSGTVDENVSGEMTDESMKTNQSMAHPELHDSEMPPPPQLRRARSTSDPKHKVKDKNTGIKHRDASGKKHSPREKKNA